MLSRCSPRRGQFEAAEGALCLRAHRARRSRAEVDTHDHRIRGRRPGAIQLVFAAGDVGAVTAWVAFRPVEPQVDPSLRRAPGLIDDCEDDDAVAVGAARASCQEDPRSVGRDTGRGSPSTPSTPSGRRYPAPARSASRSSHSLRSASLAAAESGVAASREQAQPQQPARSFPITVVDAVHGAGRRSLSKRQRVDGTVRIHAPGEGRRGDSTTRRRMCAIVTRRARTNPEGQMSANDTTASGASGRPTGCRAGAATHRVQAARARVARRPPRAGGVRQLVRRRPARSEAARRPGRRRRAGAARRRRREAGRLRARPVCGRGGRAGRDRPPHDRGRFHRRARAARRFSSSRPPALRWPRALRMRSEPELRSCTRS